MIAIRAGPTRTARKSDAPSGESAPPYDTGKLAKVSVSSAHAPAGPHVTFAAYGLPIVPSSDAARFACTHGPQEFAIDFVAIEPGASVIVLVQACKPYDDVSPHETSGVLDVFVSTYSLK